MAQFEGDPGEEQIHSIDDNEFVFVTSNALSRERSSRVATSAVSEYRLSGGLEHHDVIMRGELTKLTKNGCVQRQFILTDESLQYSHFNRDHLYPLTAIKEVLAHAHHSAVFSIIFTNGQILKLEADSPLEKEQWIKEIQQAWARWQLTASAEALTKPAFEDVHHVFERSNRLSYKDRLFKRLRKRISRQRSEPVHGQNTEPHKKLHENFSMIKYPQRSWKLPAERTVKIDRENLQLIWTTHTLQRQSLSLDRIVEVREGQRSEWFDKFPYEELESQSFSILYEESDGPYVRLAALSLICGTPEDYDTWIAGLKSLCRLTNFSFRHSQVDPAVIWLKHLWSFLSYEVELSDEDEIATDDTKKINEMKEGTAVDALKIFGFRGSRADMREMIARAHLHQLCSTVTHGHTLSSDGFFLLHTLCLLELEKEASKSEKPRRLYSIFQEYAQSQYGLTKDEFNNLLDKECAWSKQDQEGHNLLDIMSFHDEHHKAFKKYKAQNKHKHFKQACPLLSYPGLLSFLRSTDNSAINPDHNNVHQDMTQPLSHYFINSSHNTYLEGHQLNGISSCEAYIRALLQGCRCVEIDCWDGVAPGSSERIVIYHGYTLTTKLAFSDVIKTIQNYSFHNSDQPLIISIENHCNINNQRQMATTFKEIMEDTLCKDNLVEAEMRSCLPSPKELKKKILLKGSFKAIGEGPAQPSTTHVATTNAMAENGTTHEIDGVTQLGPGEDQSEKIEQVDLRKLIVYCRIASINPWSWDAQRQTSICEMFNLSEPNALELCMNSPKEMLACTERQLVRVYPHALRTQSLNYDPTLMWGCGIQIVSLNFQRPDLFMQLNQGFFRQNGGCGYVLKPDVMRRQHENGYSPFMTEPHPDVPPVDLEIELISGQYLCPARKRCISLTVDICTYGIPHDTSQMEKATHTDPIWPQWRYKQHVYHKKILMPELCLVYFKVEVVYKKRFGKSQLTGNAELYAQNCIVLSSLQQGLRYVPLRTAGGELIHQSGLFVRIIKETQGVE